MHIEVFLFRTIPHFIHPQHTHSTPNRTASNTMNDGTNTHNSRSQSAGDASSRAANPSASSGSLFVPVDKRRLRSDSDPCEREEPGQWTRSGADDSSEGRTDNPEHSNRPDNSDTSKESLQGIYLPVPRASFAIASRPGLQASPWTSEWLSRHGQKDHPDPAEGSPGGSSNGQSRR